MNKTHLPEEVRLKLRKKCLRSLYAFCLAVMGFDDMKESVHGKYCRFLEANHSRKQATMPRGFFKTVIGSIAYPIWIALPRKEADEFPTGISNNDKFYNLGPNIRILIASYVIANSMKMIGLIRKTYERNIAMEILFPEVIPENFNKIKWSNTEACINRSEEFTEATFEAGGIGGSTTSRHYDLIIEDDLIYANKDDFSGQELQPNQEDIDKAIGWHKLAMSLLVPGAHTRIHNTGTRWAKHDLVDFIRSNEPSYKVFNMSVVDPETGEFVWPEMYGKEKMDQIYAAQGPYMTQTQYYNNPIAPEDMLFKLEWLQYYKTQEEVPEGMRIFTTVDLSGWSETRRKNANNSRGVILTCGWDSKNHLWILHYDVGRFDPSEVISLLYKHHKLFNPEIIGIESVYYQKSIMHFLRKEMETRGWLPARELKTDSSTSKEIRIRALEPVASNLAIHCRPDHTDFITEYTEYVPNSNSCTKDILDALAYQIQVAKPGTVVSSKSLGNRNMFNQGVVIDKLLEHFWGRNKTKNLLDEYAISTEPNYEEDEFDAIIDPYRDTENF